MIAKPQWVLDCSITMAWCFEDEKSTSTDDLAKQFASGVSAAVPQIWPLEVGNVLTLAVKKRRISTARRAEFLAFLDAAPISINVLSKANVFNEVIALADVHQLTTYDASYLELAIRLKIPLATLDKNLRRAGVSANVPMLP
jgi:predicted nucleic acid-binding protein